MLSSRQVAVAVAAVLSLSSCSPADSGPVGSSSGGATGTGGTTSGGATGTGGSAAGRDGSGRRDERRRDRDRRQRGRWRDGDRRWRDGNGRRGDRRRNGDRWQRERGRDGNGRRGDRGQRWRGRAIGRFGWCRGRQRAVGQRGRDGNGRRGRRLIRSALSPSALVCEDFEDGKADGWSALVSGMTINGTHASSGTKALSLNIPANQRGGFISYKGAPLFPLVNKTMWGRVMVWFDSISDGHTDIVRGQAASGGNPSYNVAEQHGAYMMNYYNGSSATDCWKRPKAPTPTMVPLGKWQCWEWSFNAGTNDFQFFVDGALYVHVAMTGDGCLTGNGPWVAPTDFGMVSVGATIAETRPTVMQIWLDDIAIGTQERIGCPGR